MPPPYSGCEPEGPSDLRAIQAPMTLSHADILRIMEEEGIRPSRALGQNFVGDPNTVRRIARLAEVGPESRVVEIGAGLGSLTLALAETGATVVAVEKDRYLLTVLSRIVADAPAVTVVSGDALSLDWDSMLVPGEWALVANLPYNIAVPLVVTVLEEVPQIVRMLVMVQREVGERLAARPGDEAFGAVSVKVAYWARARVAGRVPASVFVPRPNVESVLVSLERRAEVAVPPGVAAYRSICRLVNAGFTSRRKMLRRALAGMCRAPDFEQAGIEPSARAEELSIEDWGRLAGAVGEW